MKNKKQLKQHTVIVIPSYNDSQNIHLLIEKIKFLFQEIKIIVVDDSDAQEQNKLKKFLDKQSNVELILRSTKLGRGHAVITGFKKALKNKNMEYFVEMDADLAHDPKDLAKFFSAIISSNVIVGSRYLPSSKIVDWPKRRLILSKWINRFLELLLRLNLHDYTNGFRMYDRAAVLFLTKIQLRESGFILLSETAYRLRKAGFSMKEVPISFTDRKFGKSSVGLKELFTSLLGAIKIRLLN